MSLIQYTGSIGEKIEINFSNKNISILLKFLIKSISTTLSIVTAITLS